MKSFSNIKEILETNKDKLITKYPIKYLAIFGSYVRNEQIQDSDVDIMVEFNDNIGIRFIDLANELEQLLELKVDLVSRNGIKPKYFEAIKNDLNYV